MYTWIEFYYSIIIILLQFFNDFVDCVLFVTFHRNICILVSDYRTVGFENSNCNYDIFLELEGVDVN